MGVRRSGSTGLGRRRGRSPTTAVPADTSARAPPSGGVFVSARSERGNPAVDDQSAQRTRSIACRLTAGIDAPSLVETLAGESLQDTFIYADG